MKETNRQLKVSRLLQKDLADILRQSVQDGMKGVIVSVSKVRVTSDLSIAKVYLCVFPPERKDEVIDGIKSKSSSIRYKLAQRIKNQLRIMPELLFFEDDTLDYIEKINRSLKGEDFSYIKNSELLLKRQKK